MNHSRPRIHLLAGFLFAFLALATAWLTKSPAGGGWRIFSLLAMCSAALAWFLYVRAYQRELSRQKDQQSAYPEGQARLIDSGRLPNRYNPRIELRDYEICHFSVDATRLLFMPLPDNYRIDTTNLLVRLSGNAFYFIARPNEILLPAALDAHTDGELIITNKRVIFHADENGFEVPIFSLKLLDCSAHLVDFQVRGRRYTIQTDAACYAEKVIMLLLHPTMN